MAHTPNGKPEQVGEAPEEGNTKKYLKMNVKNQKK